MALSDYSTTASSNGNVLAGIDIAENCLPSNLNNAQRQVMADLATDLARANGSQEGLATGVSFALPRGFIGMWSGSLAAIPTGWTLCDGTNGAPDLSDRFVVATGSTYTAIGATGGQNSVTLAEANIPEHEHDFSDSPTLPPHVHNDGTYQATGLPFKLWPNLDVSGGSEGQGYYYGGANDLFDVTGYSGNPQTSSTDATVPTITVSGTTTKYGSATPTAIDNRPAYYALAFIMKL